VKCLTAARWFPVVTVAAFALAVVAPFAAGAQAALPFTGLSAAEQEAVRAGHPVIRQADSASSLSLAVQTPFAEEIRGRIRSLRANYVGEVIMAMPASAGPGTLQGLARDLANVEGYVGIPYWSKQQNRRYDLFDRMKVRERTRQAAGETVIAHQHMEPFSEYDARYSYELAGAELRFRSENLTQITYRGFDAVSAGNMVWYLYGFSEAGSTYLYGVGAVKTLDLLGLFDQRLRTSFMGRIQAFFSYMYGRQRQGGGSVG